MVFPDACRLVARWCNESLIEAGESWRVLQEVPKERPERFVLLTRTGGVRLPNEVYDNAIVLAVAFAPSKNEAHDMAQWVRARMHALSFHKVDGHQVAKVDELGGPQQGVDRDTKLPTFGFTTHVPVRGRVP